jgi:membrane protease subunit HflC
MKRNTLTIVIGALLIVIFALLLFVFQVRQSEVAVVTTFGKPTAAPYDQPGAYFKWPWPIQKVYKFDKRTQNFEDKFSQGLTADNNNLILSVYVGWKISDATEFYPKFANGSVAVAQSQLESILRSAVLATEGKHPLSDFVNVDPQQLKFDEIENQIKQAVQTQLSANNYGMQLEFLGFKRFGLPESVTQSVFDRMKNERQVLISETLFNGQRDATIIRSGADRKAAAMIANANAAATRIQGEGVAEAAKTLPTFEQNPELAIFLLRIDALKSSLNQKSTLIFDERTPPFDLFQNLPTNSAAK